MARALWRILMDEPSELDCTECFAVMEYYAERLAAGSTGIIPEAVEYLQACPECEAEHREALRRLEDRRSRAEPGVNQ